MKRSIYAIVSERYLPLFGRLVLMVRCLGIGTNDPTIDGIWTEVINGTDTGQFGSDKLCCDSITADFNRPELNRYRRSGELRHLAVLPI